jgi:hypothetical protein
MRVLIAIVSLLFLSTVTQSQEKKTQPALVAMTGTPICALQASMVSVEIKPGQDVQEELTKALKEFKLTAIKFDEKTAVAVALPKNINFNDLGLAVFDKKMIAVEGLLTTTDNDLVIAACGMKGAKRVPFLIAKTATWVDEKNKNKFPGENHATIRGVARKGEIKIDSETFDWGIENADGSIPIILEKEVKAPASGATVLASGSLRAVNGRPVMKADKIESVGK